MELFSEFGVNPSHLLAQIVNFSVLLFILSKFLYKPILDVLKKREDKIKDGLAAAAKGEEILVRAKDEEKILLKKAGNEAKVMIEETKLQAGKLETGILEKAKQDAGFMMEASRRQITQEQENAEKEVERKMAVSAIAVVKQILPKVLTRKDQLRIIEDSEELLRKAVVA